MLCKIQVANNVFICIDAHIDSRIWTIKMIIFTIICAMRSPYTCTVKCAKREGHIEITEKWSNSIEIAKS